MADSVIVPISNTDWTDVSSNVKHGFFTNHADQYILYLQAETKPDATLEKGHRLNPGADKQFSLSVQEKIWCRIVSTLKSQTSVIVTAINPLPVDPQLSKTAFGELAIGQLTPQVNVDFSYVLHHEIVTTRLNNGSASVDANRMKLSTGAAANQSANLLSKHSIKYHAGLGVLVRFTGVFTAGVDGSSQAIGIGDSGDGFFFGYNGADFGLLRRKGGTPEIRSLEITTKSTTAENITITLDGIAVSVPVTDATAGDVTTTANDIAAHDFSNTGAGWQAIPNGKLVNFISFCAAPYTGTFSLSGATTAVGTFSTKLVGIEPADDWTPQTEWNKDAFDGNGPSEMILDPTKGNVYQIQYQWLGYGQIRFSVEHDTDGEFELVHTIDYANANLTPSINNPTLPICAQVENTTNTTDMVLYSGSMGAFTEGKEPLPEVYHVHIIDVTFTSTDIAPAITLHNNGVFANKLNRVRMKIINISVQVESGKPALIQIIRDAILTGADFVDHSTGESVALIDTTASILAGGEIVSAFSVASGGDKDKVPKHGDLEPTEFITIAGAQSTGGVDTVAKIIVEWSEDF